jgi:hypothetical protein
MYFDYTFKRLEDKSSKILCWSWKQHFFCTSYPICKQLHKASNKYELWRMVSSGMLRRVALVRTDVSEEPSASFIRVTRIGELGTTLAATSNRRTQYFFTACVGC